MLRLPHDRLVSRGPLKAFAITVSALAGAAAAAMAPSGKRVVAASLVAAAGSIPVLVRPQLAQRPYRAWDRAAEQVARTATMYVSWVTYSTAVLDGSPHTRTVASREMASWVDAATAPGATDADRWLNLCLATLRWVRPSHLPPDADVPTDVYTLY